MSGEKFKVVIQWLRSDEISLDGLLEMVSHPYLMYKANALVGIGRKIGQCPPSDLKAIVEKLTPLLADHTEIFGYTISDTAYCCLKQIETDEAQQSLQNFEQNLSPDEMASLARFFPIWVEIVQ